MKITNIHVRNFKTFRDCEIGLNDLNVLIGPNASGKSNFLNLFEFLRDISSFGLEDAISIQGGSKYIRNIQVKSSKRLSMKVSSVDFSRTSPIELLSNPANKSKFANKFKTGQRQKTGIKFFKFSKFSYEFEISFKDEEKFEITKDELIIHLDFFDTESGKKKLDTCEVSISVHRNKVKPVHVSFLKKPETCIIDHPEDILSPSLKWIERVFNKKWESKTLLIELSPLLFIFGKLNFSDIAIYDFDPKLAKKAIPVSGKMELDVDGANLALVLNKILSDKQKRTDFNKMITRLLPFVKDVSPETYHGKHLIFRIEEEYSKDEYLPAFLLSDGTVNVIALIVSLGLKRGPLFFEEPERNLHPRLISRLMELLKERSVKKQIFITTHNPQFVKYSDPKDLLLISRDVDGFSRISRPAKKTEVQAFLKNDLGMDDLFVQGLL